MSSNSMDVLERNGVTQGDEMPRPVDEPVENRRRIRTSPVKTTAAPVAVQPAPVTGRASVTPARTRVSGASTLSLVIGVAAILATLTGLLAPVGVILGAAAVLFSLVGIAMLRHRHVNGYGITVLGLLSGLAALVIGILAVRGELSWLSSDTDQVARVHAWLGEHASWITRW